MKRRFLLISFIIVSFSSIAQQVPKQVVVEHFTNTLCSFCASRNPGMYQTLSALPQVMHIAYYPSLPYPACQLNQHNKSEADGRTQSYGIFGATPRIVIQGEVIPANANYGDASLYQPYLNQTTSFELRTEVDMINSNTFNVHIVAKKIDTSSLNSLEIYGAILEDTVFYQGPNGEPEHYDVFRKDMFAVPWHVGVGMLVNVGDTASIDIPVTLNNAWDAGRIYVATILNDDNTNEVVQASKSAKLSTVLSAGTMNMPANTLVVYPVPTSGSITVKGKFENGEKAAIYNLLGAKMLEADLNKSNTVINISELPAGNYILKAGDKAQRIVKQ